MSEIPMYPDEGPCPVCGNTMDDAELQLEDWRRDALTLWSGRVLDEWAGDWSWSVPHMTDFRTGSPAGYLVLHGDSKVVTPKETLRGSRDSAKLAAADAMWDSLSEDARQKIGARP